MPAYSTTETALPIRNLRGSTSCCPPHTKRPTGRPIAAAICTTEIATRTMVASTAAATVTAESVAVPAELQPKPRSRPPFVRPSRAPAHRQIRARLAAEADGSFPSSQAWLRRGEQRVVSS
jgi:hypothetical protein